MKKGSSLVELLAVLVVMGIIAAIVIPTAGALIKKTKKKSCDISISNICDSYEKLIQFEDVSKDKQRYMYLDEVMEEYNVTKTSVDGNVAYQGVCKEGGIYVFTFDENGKIHGYCTGH